MNRSMAAKLLNWIIPLSLFLVPVFFVPSATVGIYSAKVTLFGLLAFLSLIIYLAHLLSSGELALSKLKFLIPFLAIPLVGLLSAVISGGFAKSFSGSVVEMSTVLFWIIGVLFALIVSLSLNNLKQLYNSAGALMLAVLAVFLVLVLKIAAVHGLFPTSLLSSIPDSLAITMIDAAVLAGLGIIIAMNALSMDLNSVWKKVVLWLAILLGVVLLASVNFKPVTILVVIFALIHFVYNFSLARKTSNISDVSSMGMENTSSRKMPVASLAVIVLSACILFGGSSLAQNISGTLKITSFDVRPGAQVTGSLIVDAWKENSLLGIGPNKFSNFWNFRKPPTINPTDFWSVDFQSGYSYLLTTAAEMGLVGSIAILSFLLLLIYAGFRAVFAPVEPTKKKLIMLFFSITLYSWLIALVYSPSISVLAVAFLSTGLFAAALTVSGAAEKRVINIFANSRSNFFGVFVVVVLMVVSISSGLFLAQKAFASSAYNETFLQNGDVDKGIASVARAASISPSDLYWRSLANLFASKIQNILQSATAPGTQISDADRANLQSAVGSGVQAAKNAIAIDSKNYLNWMSLGSVYEVLARGGVSGATGNARDAYKQAETVAPNNPVVPLAYARIDGIEGNFDQALKDVDAAIALKPNLSDAYFLKAQIEASKNDIPSAIKSVENATLVDPNNYGLFFQLGLLNYNVGNFAAAAQAFEKAVALLPNYANAKYFLGLSYELLGRRADAITQFEDLDKSNPGNQEVEFILSNLKAGKSPFTNVKPPLDNKPQKRAEPPIQENQ